MSDNRPAPGRGLPAGPAGFDCPHCGGHIEIDGVSVRLQPHSVVAHVDARAPDGPLDEVLDRVRRTLVLDALRRADGVKARAAQIVGMKYSTFYELVRRLGLETEDPEASDAPRI